MKQDTECLNKECGHKTTVDKLIEVKIIEFDLYDVGIIKYVNKDKHSPWINLVCPKCSHPHYYNLN